MDVVYSVWEAARRLLWHVIAGLAVSGACWPGGHGCYEAVARFRAEGPGRSRASVHREAMAGITAIETYLDEVARSR